MTPRETIRVLVVDDHQVVREGLRLFLSEAGEEIEVAGEAADGPEAVELAKETRPDVILMDLVLPTFDGVETTRRIRRAGIESRIVILTTFGDEQRVREAVEAGAVGYLLKDVDRSDLLAAVRAAAAGEPTLHPVAQRQLVRQVATPPEPSPLDGLTDRERDVLELIVAGASNKEIAHRLHLSIGTVKGYVSQVLDKLGVESRTQAALLAVEHGMERPPPP